VQAGAVIVGGHTVRDTEIKYGLSVTGVVAPDALMTNDRAQPGDVLVLTKALGTGFVTTAFKAGRCPDEVLQAAVASMILLNEAASQAAVDGGAHAVTDLTGFGLAGHAGEMCQASGVTARIDLTRLPLLPGADELARRGNRTRASKTNRAFAEPHMRLESSAVEELLEFAFDAQTSGGLLVSLPESQAAEYLKALRAAGHTAEIVGGVVEGPPEIVVR